MQIDGLEIFISCFFFKSILKPYTHTLSSISSVNPIGSQPLSTPFPATLPPWLWI
ncbi:hypothetical protein Hanom_Chr07g00617221 [Helianthus anomalus]